MKVLGQELGMRRCISEHLSKKYEAESRDKTLQLILYVLKQFHLEITEAALRELYLYAKISVKRMEQGFFVRMPEEAEFMKERTEFRAASVLAEELEAAERAVSLLGCEVQDLVEYRLPNGDGRSLVLIRRTGTLPAQYPRQSAKISKSPL